MKFCLSVFISLLLCAAGCTYQPLFTPADLPAGVSVTETRRTIELKPDITNISSTGLLFYPGGLVDSHVYNKLLARFALYGFTVVVVKMPSNLAVFDSEAAMSVMPLYPAINRWVIAGHSLGGSMAASVVNKHRGTFQGIIFMDSYPADGDSLADWQGASLLLFSSVEKVSDPARMDRTLSLVPPAVWLSATNRVYPALLSNYSVLHVINGGSHSRFGSYGPQDGDAVPTVSEYDFHTEVLDYMLEFFTNNNWR